MPQRNLQTGLAANDGLGTPLRGAFAMIYDDVAELYASGAALSGRVNTISGNLQTQIYNSGVTANLVSGNLQTQIHNSGTALDSRLDAIEALSGNFAQYATYRAVGSVSATVLQSDHGNGIIMTNGATSLVGVPAGLTMPFVTQIIQGGTGQVLISGNGAVVNSYGSLTGTAGQYAGATLVETGTNAFILFGVLA